MPIGQCIKKAVNWLNASPKENQRRTSGMIVSPATTPVSRYLKSLLSEIVTSGREATLNASEGLPSVSGYKDAPPPFGQVVNRLKVLSGLDPLPYRKVVSGGFEHTVRDHSFRIATTFNDGGNDAWCRVTVAKGVAKGLQDP
jgi:hypothetical protein